MGRLADQLGAIVEGVDYDAWRAVPAMVVALCKQAAPAACRLAAWADSAAGPEDRLWWHPGTRTAWAEVADLEKRADWERLPDVPGLPDVALFVEPLPPPPVQGWVLVKAADGYLAPIARPGQYVQRMMGGPTGLTEALVNGVLGGGLGYGAGWIADQFLDDEDVQKGRLPTTMGLAGAGLGAAPGLWKWTAERRVNGLGALPGMQGSGHPLPRGDAGAPPYPGYKLPAHVPLPGERGARSLPPPPFVGPPAPPKSASAHPRLQKAAQEFASGAMFLPTIPVDAFNRAIWNDVRNPPNAFGSKSPWGDDSQPMGTPPFAAAATSGLLAGAQQASQSDVISPWQVGTAAALGAGKGWVAGLAAGKVLGVLAGLKPAAQQRLQQAGVWGGLITGVANSLFR